MGVSDLAGGSGLISGGPPGWISGFGSVFGFSIFGVVACGFASISRGLENGSVVSGLLGISGLTGGTDLIGDGVSVFGFSIFGPVAARRSGAALGGPANGSGVSGFLGGSGLGCRRSFRLRLFDLGSGGFRLNCRIRRSREWIAVRRLAGARRAAAAVRSGFRLRFFADGKPLPRPAAPRSFLARL